MNQPSAGDSAPRRVQRPQRFQVEIGFYSLDQLLAADHRARAVWKYVESLDTEPLHREFKTFYGASGRPPIAPELLLALWLLATLDSVGSARALAKRCESDLPYRWLCGRVSVNYHTLSDFRSQRAEFFEKILTDGVTVMLHAGIVTLDTIAQDGMRVRANAGASSFRREPKLAELHRLAKEHVERLRSESDDDGLRREGDARRKAASERAAVEKEARLRDALEQVRQLHLEKEKREKGDGPSARCSTTDPDARKMKMGDGGFRPAYNVQFSTDADARVIVAVRVTNSGSDRGQMAPMHEKVRRTYNRTPRRCLVDSAFATHDDVTQAERAGIEVVSTVHDEEGMRKRGVDPFARTKRDTDESFRFRQRMAEPEYQALYKQRPSIAEYPNAECRNRGLRQMPVRGLERVTAATLLYAVTFNFLRMLHWKVV